MNEKMRSLVSSEEYNLDMKLSFLQSSFREMVFPKFQKVFDCITISNNFQEPESEEEFVNIIRKSYEDKTGFEACNTETYIDTSLFINSEVVMIENLLAFVFMLIELWTHQIKHIYGDIEICFIISCDPEYNSITFRFHQVRKDESLWLGDEWKDSAYMPIGCVFI